MLVVNRRALRSFSVFIRMRLMKHLRDLLAKHIDFHFALALIAIFGTAVSLYLQFNAASTEFYTLNASMYSIVRSQGRDLRDDVSLNNELDKVDRLLDNLSF